MNSVSKMKLLRWAGSKSQSEKSIAPFINFDRTYIEPFCGSASFFFSNRPNSAVLNDYNSVLIDFYRKLRTRAKALWKIYNTLETDQTSYYRVRSEFNSLKPSVKRAAYFLYLNHYCFNGIYRTNQSGHFNTPYGRHSDTKRKISLDRLLEYADISKSAEFRSADFEDFLYDASPEGTCIYMDPPYFTQDTRVFGEYGAAIFKSSDLNRLRGVVDKLSKRNKIVLTYKDCSEFREMFGGFIVGSTGVTRNVGGFSGRRKRDIELIAVAGPK